MPQACNFIKKETLAQGFSCEFCGISKNIFFIEQLCWLLLTVKGLKVNPSSKFVTEVLIFKRSRSRMFFKIGAPKRFKIFTGKHLCWPLQAFFYRTPIVAASKFSRRNYFFQVNLVFIADHHTGFCSELLRKHDLILRSSPWNSSVKKVFLEILQISQENTCVEVSF